MPDERFYVIQQDIDGKRGYAMVIAVPDPEASDKPARDSKTGAIVLTAPIEEFWQQAKEAGYRWSGNEYVRWWRHAPNNAIELPK